MIPSFTALALLGALLAAQPAAESPVESAHREIRMQTGVPVSLRLTDRVTARALKSGSVIACQVGAPLTVDGCVVFPHGAPAELLVASSSAASLAGQPDRLVLRAWRAKDMEGTWVPLDGEYSVSGDDRTLESVGAAATVSCLFLAMKGDPVVLSAGTGWVAFVGAEQRYPGCPR